MTDILEELKHRADLLDQAEQEMDLEPSEKESLFFVRVIAHIRGLMQQAETDRDFIQQYQQQVGALKVERDKLIHAVADHVTVRAEQHQRIQELKNVVESFEITEPDSDGLMWLVLHGNGTTGRAMVRIGYAESITGQVASHLEEDRKNAAIGAPQSIADQYEETERLEVELSAAQLGAADFARQIISLNHEKLTILQERDALREQVLVLSEALAHLRRVVQGHTEKTFAAIAAVRELAGGKDGE